MSAIRDYNYSMGFAVNGTAIPDPSEFSGATSSLDTSAERDANGYLHRSMVAIKHPLKMKYNNIEWSVIEKILALVKDAKFTFTYPNPETGRTKSMEAYAGDRDWDVTLITPIGVYVGSLSFSVIEY